MFCDSFEFQLDFSKIALMFGAEGLRNSDLIEQLPAH